jgi:transposase-like protein
MKTDTCPRCAHAHVVKNGTALGKARYKCRGCGYQFTRRDKRGQPQRVVHTAVVLYLFGLSMNAIARLLGVSTPAVLYWIRATARTLAQKPTPQPGQTVVLELDEMWHFLEKKLKNSGFGKPTTEPLVICLTGNAAVVIGPRSSGSSNG